MESGHIILYQMMELKSYRVFKKLSSVKYSSFYKATFMVAKIQIYISIYIDIRRKYERNLVVLPNQILGMKWLNEVIALLLTSVGIDINSNIGASIQFFIYDVIKITVLLCVLIFIISYIQSYFPPERSKKILGRFHGIKANIISALLEQ